MSKIRVREARPEDYDAVAAFTSETWSERESSDYIPRVYHDWISGDRDTKRTVVAVIDDEIAGLAQSVVLSDHEAWGQGMRVNPDFRGRGVAHAITDDLFDWAREQGATVMRNMVFSWNAAGLGNSRATGYGPCAEFRWCQPEPDADATPDLAITDGVNAAWRVWRDSDACAHLRGLALDFDESWAVSELTREDLRRARDETRLFVVEDDGARAMAFRLREYEREGENDGRGDSETETWVEYGVGAWHDVEAARALFTAISADAAERGAENTRVLIPETVGHVSDAAHCRVSFSDEPTFVMAADLTEAHRD